MSRLKGTMPEQLWRESEVPPHRSLLRRTMQELEISPSSWIPSYTYDYNAS